MQSPQQHFLKIANTSALQIMSNFEHMILHNTVVSINKQPEIWHIDQYDDMMETATSPQCLEDILTHRKPYQYLSCNATFGESASANRFFNDMKELVQFDVYYTSAYVPRGFVGWHHDGEAAHWYIMFSFSPFKAGYFRWRDSNTGTIYTDYDTDTWMIRQLRTHSDPANYFWHCCATNHDRYTMMLGFDSSDQHDAAIKLLTQI